MAYADKTYYRNTYKGRAITDDTTLDNLLERASDDIDIFCGYNFTFADMAAQFQTLIQKATCAQAEAAYFDGDDLDSGFTSVSIGSFSISGGKSGKSAGSLHGNCMKYLNLTGLTHRGIVCGQYRVGFSSIV
mgnify:FL=1